MSTVPYTLPNLPYAYDALEPHIDAHTMKIHHGKHHQSYVDKLNVAAEQLPAKLAGKSIADLLTNLDNLPAKLRLPIQNAGGGHANHSLFWTTMAPENGGEATGELPDALTKAFGSTDNFKAQFIAAATALFGSGWVWLIVDQRAEALAKAGLSITSTPNQDTPLSEGKTPLLTLDVWEHAYYLKYQNRRADYIDAWWNIVNWEQVSKNYLAAK